jgi:putative oxidoreductase
MGSQAGKCYITTHKIPYREFPSRSQSTINKGSVTMQHISNELSIALVLLRSILGVVFFMHGAQKVLGWFGGYGLKNTVGYFKSTLHIPSPLGYAAAIAEFLGSIALLFGLFTQAAALGILITMIVATLKVHAPSGFFLNATNDPKRGNGYEYSLTLAVIALVLVILGGGSFSLDAVL